MRERDLIKGKLEDGLMMSMLKREYLRQEGAEGEKDM